jgi:hypothetical protein
MFSVQVFEWSGFQMPGFTRLVPILKGLPFEKQTGHNFLTASLDH